MKKHLSMRLRQLFEDVRCDPEDYGALVAEVEALESCPTCGTPEVELTMTCHNSACAEYAKERTVYEGWRNT